MAKALIQLAYRQVINQHSLSAFEKNVFHDSFEEFLIQIQTYNPEGKYVSWQAIQEEVPKAGQNIPYKVNFAIGLYMQALKNEIPVMLDNAGVRKLSFERYEFEILASDITDRARHEVSLTYFTGVVTLYDIVGEYLLLAPGDRRNDKASVETLLVRVQPHLTIVAYQAL